MFLNNKICVIIALFLCTTVVLCEDEENNIKVRSTKRSPMPFELGDEPLTKFQAALEENAPKGRNDHERKITARKGVPNELPDLNDTTPEPLPIDMTIDKEKLQNELHVTTLPPLPDPETLAKHRPREGVDEKSPKIKNSTVSIETKKNQAKSVNESTKNGINSTKTDTTIKTSVENATQSLKNNPNSVESSKNTSTNNNSATTKTNKNNFNSSASITTPTTATTTTTIVAASTTNTTQPAASTTKKTSNTTTYVGDQVELEHKSTTKTSGKLSVDEPSAQLSKESKIPEPGPDPARGHRDYIIPVVALIFIVPIILGAVLISYRRLKDYWSTRHYRRMDFLVDGMYND